MRTYNPHITNEPAPARVIWVADADAQDATVLEISEWNNVTSAVYELTPEQAQAARASGRRITMLTPVQWQEVSVWSYQMTETRGPR